MKKNLLSLVKSSISKGYLPDDWHISKHEVVITETDYLALSYDCVLIEDKYYHEVLDADYFVFDEVDCEFILREDSISVYTSKDDYFYTKERYKGNYYEYDTYHYTYEGLDANDIIVAVDGTVVSRDEVFYWESDGEYHFEEEVEDDDEENDYDIWEYHEGPCPPDYRDNKSEPGIGFEIEKGEEPVFCGYDDKHELFDCTGCVIEKDSTVDWELKTPVYPLFSSKIEEEWLPEIESAINADNHEGAGGHIHLSLPPKSGKQLFDYCRPYLPLFMAMYPQRLESTYCKGKSEKSLKSDYEKHQAIQILRERIELRFPAKVYNMKALLFRLNFCRLMVEKDCQNIYAVTLSAFDNSTNLGKLIAQEYKEREQILLSRLIAIAKKYFNTNLLNEKSIELLFNDLKTKKLCA